MLSVSVLRDAHKCQFVSAAFVVQGSACCAWARFLWASTSVLRAQLCWNRERADVCCPQHTIPLPLISCLFLIVSPDASPWWCLMSSNVRVTWVQPRVMDRESIQKQLVKLKDWMDKVQETSVFLANEGVSTEIMT